ncbi:MAG TPA: hypothetical protein VMF89_32795 [Polyangiales bacterium]|nr:hypothetical protein [Polyangiales bacterium]
MSSVPPETATSLAEAWAKKLSQLREHSVQVGWTRSELLRIGAVRAADVLSVVLARAEQREERYAVLLLRVSLALSTPTMSALKGSIAAVAHACGQSSLARFLGHVQVEADPEQEEAPASERDIPDFGRGRPLTLGERKSLARTHDRNLLARVLRDPHPDVIKILLDNPTMVEADVVRLCARRPSRPDVLNEVFLHQRWVLRYRVRLTLALNPFTPEEVALQILPHLSAADLREVRSSGQISPRVREACAEKHEKALH